MSIKSRLDRLEAKMEQPDVTRLSPVERERRITELLSQSHYVGLSREQLQEIAESAAIPKDKPITHYTPAEREARIAQLLLKATVR